MILAIFVLKLFICSLGGWWAVTASIDAKNGDIVPGFIASCLALLSWVVALLIFPSVKFVILR
jgi:hypothetical protein